MNIIWKPALAVLFCLSVWGCSGSDRTSGAQPLAGGELPCAETLDDHFAGESSDLPLDDRSTMLRLQRQTTRLINDKKFASAKLLRDQLKVQDQCVLKLGAAAREPLSPVEIYRLNKPGVLIVAGIYKCGKCSKWHANPASGFAIKEDGVIVTNYHVINHSKHSMFVMTDEGKIYPISMVLAANEAEDVAICQVDLPKGEKLHPLPLNPEAPPGTPVTVISHPRQNFYTLTQGHVSRYFKRPGRQGKVISQMSITADYAKGSSGAPLFDDKGNVIGLVKATASLYGRIKDGNQENLQMVLKHCATAQSILDLIEDE